MARVQFKGTFPNNGFNLYLTSSNPISFNKKIPFCFFNSLIIYPYRLTWSSHTERINMQSYVSYRDLWMVSKKKKNYIFSYIFFYRIDKSIYSINILNIGMFVDGFSLYDMKIWHRQLLAKNDIDNYCWHKKKKENAK